MAGKSVAKMSDVEKRLAQFANDDVARAGAEGGSTISVGGRRFSMKGEVLGSEISVVVLDYVRANDYYDRDYDEEETHPPACFMRSASDDGEEQPHVTAPAPQSEYCNGCPMDEWGSAAQGEGKACRNSFRLIVMEEGAVFEDADKAFMSVPPSSMKNWRAYVRQLQKKKERPPFAVVTRIGFDDDFNYPVLTFEFDSMIKDADVLNSIMDNADATRAEVMKVPDVSNYESPGSSKKTKKKAAKKKTATRKAAGGGKKKAASKKKGRSKFSA